MPPSGDNPIPEYEAPILAFEDAILASQARAKPSPPPAHAPFIAAMEIFGDWRILIKSG